MDFRLLFERAYVTILYGHATIRLFFSFVKGKKIYFSIFFYKTESSNHGWELRVDFLSTSWVKKGIFMQIEKDIFSSRPLM